LKPAGAPQPPSAPPVHQDPTATSTTAQPLATVPAPTLPALVNPQAFAVAVAAAPQAGVTIDALAVHVARKFQEGSSQFEIRLQPMELGRLDISLTVAEDGRVQAVLRIERPETLDMLQRDARLLEQQLRQAGLEVGSNALSFSLSNGNGQRPAPFTAWPAFADAQNAAGAAKDEAASTYIAVRTRDGVDIRV
jgi:flagellar hook-length control protein FliK